MTKQTDGAGSTVSYSYDAIGRLTAIYDAEGRRIFSVLYDASGRPKSTTNALNKTVKSRYKANGQLDMITDALGNQTQYTFDGLNQLTQVKDSKDGISAQTFDEANQLTSLKDPAGNETKWTYDQAGRILSETNSTGGKQLYEYNSCGQLSSEHNARGQTTKYQYDGAGHLISFTDEAGNVTYTYDASGNITSVTDEKGNTLKRTYDALNRVETYTDQDGNQIGYEYDQAGNLKALIYPDKKKVQYTYDANHRLKEVTDPAGRKTTYTYDKYGNLEQTIRPDGSKETRTYDAAGQLLTLSDRAADGSSISEYTFTYDANGNVSTEDNKVPDITVQGPEQKGAGLSPSTLLAGKAEMAYGKDNRLDTYNGMKVEYDADGNQITGPLGESRESFKYDARNRLIQAGQTAYAYNSENNRISVTKGNSVTKYVVNPHAMLSQILMETDGNGKGQAWYVYGLGLIGREDSEGTYQTYHYDRRGSTVALTALSGEVTDRYVYGPYGELLRKTGDTKQPFLYNGRDGVVTDDNGLYCMRARYYNPDIKRFINRDVLTGSISVGQSLNRYAYVNGNPVSYVDPFGLSRDSDTSPYAHAANFVLDFIPFVGSIKGAFEAFTGVDVITGETLSASDRWAAGIGSVLGALPIPGAKQGGKYLTKGTIELEEQLEKSLVSAGTSKYRLPMDLQLFAGKAGSGAKSIANMAEFFSDGFGKSIKNNVTKTKNQFQGQSIYKVTKKTDNSYLKKGDGLYLYNLHKDHLEIIDSKGKVKAVLNLDGSLNVTKTEKVLKEGRRVKW